MNTLWILAAIVAVASGDVGLGYHYKVPQTSYGVPSYQFGESSSGHGSSSGFNYKGHSSQSGYIGSTVSPTSSTGFISHTTLNGAGHHAGHSQLSGSGVSGLYYPPAVVNTESKSNFFYPSSINIGSGATNLAHPTYSTFTADSSHSVSPTYNEYQNQHLTSAAHKYQQYYIQQQAPQVYKHYFVHTAPEEPELPKPRKSIVLPPPQKHYKIIFVKTPSETRTPQVIPVPQQHEEKTIVYVLSKKQDQPEDILVPKIENKPPTKPEVYFVKYKNKEDSQAVIDGIVSDYNKGQAHSVTFSGLDNAHSDAFGSSGSQSFGSGSSGSFGSGSSGSFGSGSSGSFGSGSSGSFGSGSSGSFGSGSSGSFGSSSSGSFSNSGSHDALATYPIYSTGSHSLPSFSQGQYTEKISYSPLNIHGTVDDFVTETYDLNKVSSVPESFTVGPSDSSNVAGLLESSTAFGGLLSGNNIVSTTASSLAHDDSHFISTSQGLPHETYGPPKFRTV